MNTLSSPIGTCPRCDSMIPSTYLLIEYERNNRPAAYAECPNCDSIVRPIPIENTRS